MQQIPIFLINLDRAGNRLSLMRERLDAAGLEFERFPAVDGSKLDPKFIEDFAPSSSWKGKGRPHPGEVGNFLSHLRVLETMLERKYERACILEDDVELDSTFASFLDSSLPWPTKTDVLKLEIALPEPRVRVLALGHVGPRELVFIPRGGASGSAAYIISYEGVAKLIPTLRRMTNFHDWQAFTPRKGGITISHVFPLPVRQSLATEIERPKTPRQKRPRIDRLRHSFLKRYSTLKRSIEEFQYCSHVYGTRAALHIAINPSWRETEDRHVS